MRCAFRLVASSRPVPARHPPQPTFPSSEWIRPPSPHASGDYTTSCPGRRRSEYLAVAARSIDEDDAAQHPTVMNSACYGLGKTYLCLQLLLICSFLRAVRSMLVHCLDEGGGLRSTLKSQYPRQRSFALRRVRRVALRHKPGEATEERSPPERRRT